MQTRSYREAKQSLINHSKNGWKYIDFFIISPEMFEELLAERDSIKGGRRILLEAGEKASYKGLFIKGSVFGYPVMVCEGFVDVYGVIPVQFHKAFEPYHQYYIERNISDQINEQLKDMKV